MTSLLRQICDAQTFEMQESAQRRNRSIKLAVLTSILSKGGTAVLTLVALPVAAHVLSRELFGLYLSIALTITSAQLLSAGIGPALVHGLSSALARGDRPQEQKLYATSFWLLAALLGTGAAIATTILSTQPISVILGEKFVPFEANARPALWTGVILFLLTLMFSHTERVREGCLEAQVNNTWGAVGNILTAVAVIGGIWLWPSVEYLLVATFGCQLLVRFANTIQLLIKRSWLRPSPSLVDKGMAKELFVDGFAYTAYGMVVNFVETNVAMNLLGRLHGPHATAMFGNFISWLTAGLGVVVMVTTASWPAIVDAKVRGDQEWIKRTVKRLYGIGTLVGIGAIICTGLIGQWVMVKQYGVAYADAVPGLCLSFGIYFALHVWRHVGHMVHVGLGRVKWLALIQVVESVIIAGALWWAVHSEDMQTVFLAMAVCIACGTAWILPLMAWREIRSISEQPAPVSASTEEKKETCCLAETA